MEKVIFNKAKTQAITVDVQKFTVSLQIERKLTISGGTSTAIAIFDEAGLMQTIEALKEALYELHTKEGITW